MPSPRIDWEGIKQIIGSVEKTEPYLFVLPHAGRHLMLALSERLHWKSTYKTDGYDFADFDDLDALVSETQRGLMGDTRMDDLVSTLALLIDEIRNLKVNLQTTVNCCELAKTVQTDDPGTETGEGDPPPMYGDDTIVDWDDYRNHICGAADAWVDGMISIMLKLADAIEDNLLAVGGIAVLLGLAAATGILMPINFALAIGMFTVLVALITNEPLSDLVEWFGDERQILKEKIACAGNATQAALDIRSYLQAELTSTEWNIVRWLDIESAMAVIYAGEDSEGNKLSVTPLMDCNCDQTGAIIYSWLKAAGSDQIQTLPDGAYAGIGWTGGVIWAAVEVYNNIAFIVNPPMSVDGLLTYSVTTAGDSPPNMTITARLNDSSEVVLGTASAGETVAGTLALLSTQAAWITCTIGTRLSSWSWVVTES